MGTKIDRNSVSAYKAEGIRFSSGGESVSLSDGIVMTHPYALDVITQMQEANAFLAECATENNSLGLIVDTTIAEVQRLQLSEKKAWACTYTAIGLLAALLIYSTIRVRRLLKAK